MKSDRLKWVKIAPKGVGNKHTSETNIKRVKISTPHPSLNTVSTNPTVRIPNGVLQGAWKVSTKGRTFASFQGVPYARPPVGKYRFKEPTQMKSWVGTWDASGPLSGCLQYDGLLQKITGSENCLFVNVYTPKLSPGANFPVLVFIHGGAFMYGQSDIYDPVHLMDRDVVVVTMNYRLGPLGFLSTGDEVIPGNNGLKDQSAALHWIRHNIMMFGGNPDSVTLTGNSAGAASVHYHYLSPLSRGTFHRGIAFSGSAFASWTHAVKPAQKAKALAAIVGCPTGSSREILECLKFRPAEVIVNAQVEMLEWKVHMFSPFVPTAEASGVREPFLSHYPYIAAKLGAMVNLPLIASVTTEEGLYPAAVYQAHPGVLAELESHWSTLASNIFEYNDTLPLDQRAAVAEKIKEHYLGGKPVSQETFPELVQALGDRLFVADVGRLAQMHASQTSQPTYVYRYSHRGAKSLSTYMTQNDKNYGVCHADDVMHIFRVPFMTTGPEDMPTIDVLINMVYSFATTGIPNLNNGGPEWTPINPRTTELDYLDIQSPTKSEMKTTADFGQRHFWDSLGFIENDRYHVNIKDEL